MRFLERAANAIHIQTEILKRTVRRASLRDIHIDNSLLLERHAALVEDVIENTNVLGIKKGLMPLGLSGNFAAKRVKKAMRDVENAVISAGVMDDTARASALVVRRVRRWCQKIDPLKK